MVASSIAVLSILVLNMLALEFRILSRGCIGGMLDSPYKDSLICERLFFVLILLNLSGLGGR